MSKQLERLSKAGLKTPGIGPTASIGCTGDKLSQSDIAFALCGLSQEAAMWASVAYTNSDDPKALNSLVARLSKLLLRKFPKMQPKVITGLVRICINEAMVNEPKSTEKKSKRVLTATAKAKEMGISRKTFYQNQSKYDEITKAVMYVIQRWDEQITKNVNKRIYR
ncbi:hypothetical protein [Vibrio harveyi]|uniref:hypothetical protein n=1 Tax=Vibrio harveyi TaxID=669 RepID=UPI003CF102A5